MRERHVSTVKKHHEQKKPPCTLDGVDFDTVKARIPMSEGLVSKKWMFRSCCCLRHMLVCFDFSNSGKKGNRQILVRCWFSKLNTTLPIQNTRD